MGIGTDGGVPSMTWSEGFHRPSQPITAESGTKYEEDWYDGAKDKQVLDLMKSGGFNPISTKFKCMSCYRLPPKDEMRKTWGPESSWVSSADRLPNCVENDFDSSA